MIRQLTSELKNQESKAEVIEAIDFLNNFKSKVSVDIFQLKDIGRTITKVKIQKSTRIDNVPSTVHENLPT